MNEATQPVIETLGLVKDFRHSPAMPVEHFDPAGALGRAVIAAAFAGLAAYVIQRRDHTS